MEEDRIVVSMTIYVPEVLLQGLFYYENDS
jgi:hypothetical protein